MPQPGFYNDNEYRAYPFIYTPVPPATTIPNSVVVDAGFVMGLDINFDFSAHSIWLHSISLTATDFVFVFKTNATAATLTFSRPIPDDCVNPEWLIEYADAATISGYNETNCAEEPSWRGFLVTGPLCELKDELLANGNEFTFGSTDYKIEPGRIQSLAKAYLRSISVGNYDRTRVPDCDSAGLVPYKSIIVNARCMKGDIRLKEGYNCQITQTDRANNLSISAAVGAGAPQDAALCAHGGEIPLYPDEPYDTVTGFYSGGPACSELITTINGVSGSQQNIIGGTGVTITVQTVDNQSSIAVTAAPSSACAQPTT